MISYQFRKCGLKAKVIPQPNFILLDTYKVDVIVYPINKDNA
jgi:hypothetical protein